MLLSTYYTESRIGSSGIENNLRLSSTLKRQFHKQNPNNSKPYSKNTIELNRPTMLLHV